MNGTSAKILVLCLLLSSKLYAQNIGAVRAQFKTNTAVSAPKESLKSYRQWKNEKIQDAMAKVSSTRSSLEVRKIAQSTKTNKIEAATMKDMNSAQLEIQLRADIMVLEMAKDLTVSDYFAGYLSKLNNKNEAVKEIAHKMTSDEVAELMMAYSNSLFGSSPAGLPVQAAQGLGR